MAGDSEAQKKSDVRARSLPYRQPFWMAVVFWLFHLLTLGGLAAAIVWLFMMPSLAHCHYVLYGAAGCLFTWLLAFLKRRKVFCPLCRGTPYLNSGAHPHAKAKRWWPLNHGLTAICSTILNSRFQCMYCGEPFDLRKKPARLRHQAATKASAESSPITRIKRP